jgi:uncharacterized protein YpbB
MLGLNCIESLQTTEIYTYVNTKKIQQIKSPFDNLGYFFMFVQEISVAVYSTKPAEICCTCVTLWLV